ESDPIQGLFLYRSPGPGSPIMIHPVDIERSGLAGGATIQQLGFNPCRVVSLGCGAGGKVNLLLVITAVRPWPIAYPQAIGSLRRHNPEPAPDVFLHEPRHAQARACH